jgi:hypothetical protein
MSWAKLAKYQNLFLLLTTKPFIRDRLVPAKDAACPARLVPKVNKASPVNQENQAILVIQDSQAWYHQNIVWFQLNHHATHARQVHQVPLVLQEKMVDPELQAKMVAQVKTVLQAQLAHLVPQEVQEARDQMDHEVTQVETLAEQNHNQEMPDQQAQTVNQVQQAQQEMQAKMEAKAPTDPKDHQAQRDQPAKMANQETKDHQAKTAKPEKRVFAPNIALSMVVSSSKMVQGDKRWLFNIHTPYVFYFLKSILFLLECSLVNPPAIHFKWKSDSALYQ